MPFFKSEGFKMLEKRGYVFERKLGEGAYSKVWLTTLMQTNADNGKREEVSLACKIIDTSLAERRFVIKFLPRELDILPKLKHPYLVYCHAIYQVKSVFYIFTSFAAQGDLLDYILKHGHLDEAHARVWACQLAMGIQFLHKLDIAHRDIKCENILITARNNIKLADFGFARFLCDSTTGEYRLSRTFCGSLAYAAPEVLKADRYDGKISDVWSFGVVVFVMLNQVMPFRETSVDNMYKKQMQLQWKFRPAISKRLSKPVIQFVTHLLEPRPDERYTIDNAVNDQWFAPLIPLMADKIAAAVDFAKKNRQHLLPASVRVDLPVWNRKQQKDIVQLTDLSFEEASDTVVMAKTNSADWAHSSVHSAGSASESSSLSLRNDLRTSSEEDRLQKERAKKR